MVDIPNNIASTATFLGNPTFGASFSGELEFFGDSDWIAVTLIANTTYTFFGSVEGPGFNVGNSYLTLHDATGDALFSNDNDPVGGTQNSLLIVANAAPGTYFINIGSIDGTAGSYSVAVTAQPGSNNRLDVNDESAPAVANQKTIGDKGDDTISLGSNSHGLGEQGDDLIVGNATANFISGGLGNDTLFGNAGADAIFGDGGFDSINGGDGNDTLYGGDGADQLLDPTGFDTIRGGDGGDVVDAGADNDFVYGEGGDDMLLGQNGTDVLDGGAGIDEMQGGASDDTYYVDNAADKAMELAIDGTNDRVFTTVSYTLLAGQEIEVLRAQFSATTNPLNLTGNEFANTMSGNNGVNVLRGSGGADVLQGLLGNDTYALENGNGTVVDSGGLDTITSTVGRSLVSYAAIERLALVGTAAISGIGNNLANILTGNAAANGLNGGFANDTLNGGTGNDTLDGGAHNDTLLGVAGNDVLIGNLGRDVMTGGLGNDVFRFAAKSHSTVGANADVIKDFDDFGNDKIDVSGLFGAAMTYRHNGAFTAAGQLRINDIAGADVIVEVNTGGTLAADFAIRLAATALASMGASDFVL